VDVEKPDFIGPVMKVYDELGGRLLHWPLNLRRWDLEFSSKRIKNIAIELDEHLHFNRYRAVTLESPMYSKLSDFPRRPYTAYCAAHEGACLKAGRYGRRWSNPSCEYQFGPPSPPGVLAGNGAPRWRQRAFYDFVKDLSPLVAGVKVVRIAIWDEICVSGQTRLVEDVLSNRDNCEVRSAALVALITQRISA
jgi:hypothetical protein